MLVYGSNPAISLEQPDRIRIAEKAEFSNPLFDFCACCGDPSRTYLYVLENGITMNHPTGSGIPFIPPNCLCYGFDNIWTFYYDRAIYDQRGRQWKTGCFNGDPIIVANDVKYVCFCQECTLCSWNGFGPYLGFCFYICGKDIPDRIRYLPMEYHCCCIPLRANFLTNFCGLCGIKSGEPCVLLPFVGCLKKGSGESLALSINNARAEWKRRTQQA